MGPALLFSSEADLEKHRLKLGFVAGRNIFAESILKESRFLVASLWCRMSDRKQRP
jgi:hypothetical protein